MNGSTCCEAGWTVQKSPEKNGLISGKMTRNFKQPESNFALMISIEYWSTKMIRRYRFKIDYQRCQILFQSELEFLFGVFTFYIELPKCQNICHIATTRKGREIDQIVNDWEILKVSKWRKKVNRYEWCQTVHLAWLYRRAWVQSQPKAGISSSMLFENLTTARVKRLFSPF